MATTQQVQHAASTSMEGVSFAQMETGVSEISPACRPLALDPLKALKGLFQPPPTGGA